MQTRHIDEYRFLGGALVVLGLALGAAGAVSGLLAIDHMAVVAALCGPATGHCGLCLAAGSLLVASVGATGAGLRFLLEPRVAAYLTT